MEKKNFYCEKVFFRKKLFIQKYVLQIKIYIFLNYIIIPQKKIFDHKKYIC